MQGFRRRLRAAFLDIHWLLGITAGLVLAVVGVTGALLSFEDELLTALNRGAATVAPRAEAPLALPELVARVRDSEGARVTAVTLWSDRGRSVRMSLVPASAEGRGRTVYVDPYTGASLGEPRGTALFRQTRQIHRYLAADRIGKQIVGASTVALVVLCLTGLYLRWPRRIAAWRAWLTFDVRRKGRPFLYGLHSVAGTWVLVPYLVMGLTGLYWSYEFYRDALYAITGAPRPVRPAGAAKGGAGKAHRAPAAPAVRAAPAVDLAAVWNGLGAAAGAYSTVTLRLPERAGQPVQAMVLGPSAAHDRAWDRVTLDASSGRVLSHERYADRPVGAKLMSGMLALHSGSFFGVAGVVIFMVSSLAMPLFAASGLMLYIDRRRRRRDRLPAGHASAPTRASS